MPIGSDVAEVPATNPPTAPTYCQVADVARYAQLPIPPPVADEGALSRGDWEALIIDTEAEVDRTCGTSWRAMRIELEYHDWTTLRNEENWKLVPLRRSPVRTLSAGAGDHLEVRQGGSWEDWLATKTEGINGHYWVQEDLGFLWLRRGPWEYSNDVRVRVSFRYGHSAVPQDIKTATALLVAVEILSGHSVSSAGHGGGGEDRVGLQNRINRMMRRAYSTLASHQHVGGM